MHALQVFGLYVTSYCPSHANLVLVRTKFIASRRQVTFVAVGMLCTRNNTDGNKLVIFSGIALW